MRNTTYQYVCILMPIRQCNMSAPCPWRQPTSPMRTSICRCAVDTPCPVAPQRQRAITHPATSWRSRLLAHLPVSTQQTRPRPAPPRAVTQPHAPRPPPVYSAGRHEVVWHGVVCVVPSSLTVLRVFWFGGHVHRLLRIHKMDLTDSTRMRLIAKCVCLPRC